jgi:pyruvate/2-oxoglutarate dehydrogenase complex dihydrolipoamide dehydrogenase (E3) component
VKKPWELVHAELIDGLCQRYGCLPSQLMQEDAEILRLVAIVQEGKPEEANGE